MREENNNENQAPSSNNANENNINKESNDKNKNFDDKSKSNEKKGVTDMELEKEEKKGNGRSEFSLEGAKGPLSMYTRRVMDISKIGDYLKPGSSKGQIGGHNLGNTCFMNSSIACISNCTELTYYFLKGDYLKDINEENDLGMRGEVAREWGKLLEEYWVKNTSVGDPSDFKRTIGRKAVRFRGFGQQDSNEFMSVFLDYLNEDLNKTTKKQYIELKEKAPDETDEQCAKRFWEANLKRNDSIITDLFCGQFKSTITCPECGWINITFDPFDTINLPLLTQHKRRGYGFGSQTIDEMKFYYIPKNVFRNTYCLLIKEVNKGDNLNDVIERIKKEKDFVYHDKIDELFMVDMFRGKKYGYAKKNESIEHYTLDDEYLYSFDLDKNNSDIIIPLYLWEKDDEESKSKYPRIIFCNNNDNFDILRKKIYFYIRKFILSPLLKENEEKDALSLEIEKYIGDMKNELPDEKLYELVEKEYNEIFNKYNTLDEQDEEKEKKDDENEEMKNVENEETEKKEEEQKSNIKNTPTSKEIEEYNKCIEKFKSDIPFKITMREEGITYKPETISLLKSETFPKFNKKLKDFFEMKNFSIPLKDTKLAYNKYEVHVKFNPESKYINKDTFDIRLVDSIKFDYKPKKKEEKKPEEDDENGEMTLEKCLKKFCKEEQLEEGDEWYCSKCKKHVLAKKKMELYYVPKILIICLKRFIKDSFSWEKNEDKVDFPIDNLDLKNFVIGPDKDHSKYDLFAVSQHYGSTGFGHYTAVCKNDGKWFSYNDSSCRQTSSSDAQTSAAYVLFYRRETD